MDANDLRQRQRALYEAGEYFALADALTPAAVSLVGRAAPSPDDLVLDVGAGDGSVARAALGRAGRVCACDLSPVQAIRGRDRTPRAEWCAADAGRLPFADDTFDVTLSSFGAIWAPDPEQATAELFRVTRSGGTVGITTWPATSFQSTMIATVAAEVSPDVLADQLLGWDDEATARARFAEHGKGIDYWVGTFLYDEEVRGKAGDRDCGQGWFSTSVPDDLKPKLQEIGKRVWDQHVDERGRCWMEFAVLCGRKRAG